MTLTDSDQELIDRATAIIRERYKLNRHHVGAAVRSTSGAVYAAVNVDTYLGRAAVCAEAIAIGMMLSAGEEEIAEIVAVYLPNQEFGAAEPYVASPCGVCREMLADYGPQATVLYLENDEIKKSTATELLPGKYVKRHLPR